jgi:hypothetical protein
MNLREPCQRVHSGGATGWKPVVRKSDHDIAAVLSLALRAAALATSYLRVHPLRAGPAATLRAGEAMS